MARTEACVCGTDLGRPVVPPVKKTSEGAGAAPAGLGPRTSVGGGSAAANGSAWASGVAQIDSKSITRTPGTSRCARWTTLAYGLDAKAPINRTGTRPLGNGPDGDQISFEDQAGVAVYNGQDLNSEAFQRKLVDDCKQLEKLEAVVRSGKGDKQAEVFCFMKDFKVCAGLSAWLPACLSVDRAFKMRWAP